jgi:hypothetical protein
MRSEEVDMPGVKHRVEYGLRFGVSGEKVAAKPPFRIFSE